MMSMLLLAAAALVTAPPSRESPRQASQATATIRIVAAVALKLDGSSTIRTRRRARDSSVKAARRINRNRCKADRISVT